MYAAVIEVDNSGEDPQAGRQGLRDELLPVLKMMPGFVSASLLTAYDQGRGVAVVTFETPEDAARLTAGVTVGQELRPGVTGLSTRVFEVSASAPTADTSDDSKRQVLRDIAAGFDTHDLDRIMRHFTDDCVFESPRGTQPNGRRVEGADAVRAAFADRFAGIPDVRYTDDTHFVAGDRGVSEWLLSGTDTNGERIEVRGCDIWTFRDDKIVVKNSFWKIRVPQ